MRQADEAASHAASILQASLLSLDHTEQQQQQQQEQQQRLRDSNLNLPRIVGLSSTLCLLDLPDLKRLKGKDGKLALPAERVTSICPFHVPKLPLYRQRSPYIPALFLQYTFLPIITNTVITLPEGLVSSCKIFRVCYCS